jgi:hypothetical protein
MTVIFSENDWQGEISGSYSNDYEDYYVLVVTQYSLVDGY